MNVTLRCYINKFPIYYVPKKTHLITPEYNSVISGIFRENTSVIDPEIEVDLTKDNSFQQILQEPPHNYVYIPELYRYYFIRNVVKMENGIYLYILHCDVLETYWDSIKGTEKVIVSRTQNLNKSIPDLKDAQLWTTANQHFEIITFASGSKQDAGESLLNNVGQNYVITLFGAGGEL